MKVFLKYTLWLLSNLLVVFLLIFISHYYITLIVLPILFIINYLFLKNRILLILINFLIVLPFILFFIIFRFSTEAEIVIKSKIRYQVIDFGQGDFPRSIIESNLNNRRVFLADTDSVHDIYWLYVDKAEFMKFWNESPFKLREEGYTYEATFYAKKLFFIDGYSKANVKSIKKTKGRPIISK